MIIEDERKSDFIRLSECDSLPYLAFYDNKAVAPSATVKIWKPTKKVADYRELNIDWEQPDEIINVAEYKEKSSEKTDSKKP